MNILIAVLLTAALVALAVFTKKKPGRLTDRLNTAVFLIGVLLLVGVVLHACYLFNGHIPDEDLRGWAADMLGVWATYAGIVAVSLFVLILLSLLLSLASPDGKAAHKLAYAAGLRSLLTLLTSVLFLLAAALYATMAAHDGLPTGTYVLLSGIGSAFLFRIFAPIESLLRRRNGLT